MTQVERISMTPVGIPTSPAAGPAVAVRPAPGPITSQPAPAPRVNAADPRYKALRNFAISMSIFNILGYAVLGFEQPWTWPLFALAVGYSTELVVEIIAAALSANMLLYANSKFWPIAFAVAVAIGQKAILQAPIKGRMRHFMNPSNFGITVTLLAFSWVNVAPPYHFTENVPDVIRILVPLVILSAGTVLNAVLTKKVGLIMGWAGGFVIQALIRHYVWDVALWASLGIMTGVAFVLFTNYMITDPGTTPSSFRNQFMFGSSVATVYGILMLFNVVYTLFFAVTIVCLIRGLYWWATYLRDRRRDRLSLGVIS